MLGLLLCCFPNGLKDFYMLAKCLIEGIVALAWKLALLSHCVAAAHDLQPFAPLQCGACVT